MGKCREATKGTGSRQELATNEVSRLRDYSGSLEKGAGCEQREQPEGLKGIALFIQIPYAPKKSLRLALRQPTSLYKGGNGEDD